MTGFAILERAFLGVETVAALCLLMRFLLARLNQTYRYFFIYLIVFCVQLLGPLLLKRKTNAYGWFFFFTEGVIACLYASIVLELYSLVLRDLPGIASIARRFIWIALAIAIVVSLLLLGIERPPQGVIAIFLGFERPIVSSLVFFVFLITGFLFYYPIPLGRNVIYYTVGYAVYFTGKATALLFNNTGLYWNELLSVIVLGVSAACLVFWLFALKPEGERKSLVLGPKLGRENELSMLTKLEALNASLLRARQFPQSRPE